jgi:hypothetical protein
MDTQILIWDVAAQTHRPAARAPALAARELEALWSDLASDDTPRAGRAVEHLAAAPRQAAALLRERLHPVEAADAQAVARLLANLDSADFTIRDKAVKELEALGEGALGSYRRALESHPSLEMRRRLEALLDKLSGLWRNPAPERLRTLRALEVLELAGTPEARQVLQVLEKGVPGARLTEEAKAAHQRLAQRAGSSP